MKTAAKFSAALLVLAAACTSVHAALPVIPAGERVVFSDDFADNHNAWTNLAVINGKGEPASTKADLVKSEWTPSLADHATVGSVVTFKTPIALGKGVLSLYMCVRIGDIEGVEGSRFWMTLNESAFQNHFAGLVIRPAANGAILYRNDLGTGDSTSTASTRDFLRDSSTAYTFKLTLTASADGKGPASAEAFYYNIRSAKYVSLGKADAAVFLKSGIFTSFAINCRNGENGTVWFDSVAVTQSAAAVAR